MLCTCICKDGVHQIGPIMTLDVMWNSPFISQLNTRHFARRTKEREVGFLIINLDAFVFSILSSRWLALYQPVKLAGSSQPSAKSWQHYVGHSFKHCSLHPTQLCAIKMIHVYWATLMMMMMMIKGTVTIFSFPTLIALFISKFTTLN